MKKYFLLLLLALLPLHLASAQTATTTTERITNYVVNINVKQDSSILVDEQINYDFGATPHHGIFRDIPYKYEARGGTFSLRISDVLVTDENGTRQQFTQSTTGGNIELKIGNPDVTITGVHIYDIHYTVKRALNYFSDHDELYWNAIGTGWQVPIEKSQVSVTVPQAVLTQASQAVCYTGAQNSNQQGCTVNLTNQKTAQFTYNQVINPGQGFTVVVGFPKGVVQKPTTWQNIQDTIRDNVILGLPLLVLLIMFFIWRKYGRSAKGRGVIVPQYEPPAGISPMVMGSLVDGKLEPRDFTSEIIYLATLGCIKISRIETTKLWLLKGHDYELLKLADLKPEMKYTSTDNVLSYLFDDVASIKLSELKTKTFGSHLRGLRKRVFEDLTKQGYFRINPTKLRSGLLSGGVTMALISFWGLGIFSGGYGLLAGIASGVIIALSGLFMTSRTEKGAEMKEYILGFKLYLSVAEKDRLEFANAPEKTPERFEKFLPYAIALGVESQWAKQFEGIYNTSPSWYSDPSSASFNALILTSSLNNFSSSMQSVMTSQAAGGSSGFGGGGVGGGGGGGGGGSW